MAPKSVQNLFKEQRWEKISESYSPVQVAGALSFKDSVILSYKLLYNDMWDEQLQEYAVTLLYAIRDRHHEEWGSSWQYDAFLGKACDVTLRYDERYEAYKRAYERANPPPPGLLIELAGCCYSPGSPPLSYDDAITLLEKAINDYPYIDGIRLLKGIYASKKDKKNEAYWAKILEDMKNTETRSPPIEPNFLR